MFWRAADAVLLGRETYETLSKVWPEASGPHAELNSPVPEDVASRTPTGPLTWNAELPFHAGELPIRLRLITATPYSSGVVQLSYQPVAG